LIPRLPDLRAFMLAQQQLGHEVEPAKPDDPCTFGVILDACLITRHKGYR
jgi:hypothetical protein